MLHCSSAEIQHTLRRLLSSAQQYAADVCFEFPDNTIWAHRAIILARAPSAFVARHLPELQRTPTDNNRVTVYRDLALPHRTLTQLLHFWYTAEFRPDGDAGRLPSLSTTATNDDDSNEILRTIREGERVLGTPLLMMPSCDNPVDPVNQLVADITHMYEQQLAADVTIILYAGSCGSGSGSGSGSGRNSAASIAKTASFAVHRCILAAQSSYFYAMFCKEFSEASSPVVYLPSDIFSPDAFQVILDYYYTGSVQLAPTSRHGDDDGDGVAPSLQPGHDGHRLAQKIQMVRVFQEAFRVAEYMGQYDTVCQALLHATADILKQHKCTCRDCAALLPSMLWFSDRFVPDLRAHLVTLYADPVYALATLWPAPTFGVLLESMPALAAELVQRMMANIKKQTAIQVLEALHLCLSRVRNAGVREIVDKQLVSHTVQMISDNFGFYCVEYPILLSCVDGVAVGSVDFLEFLLTQLVQQGINERNAGGLYQGIVRDLIGRHQEMDAGGIVDNVLLDARQRCIDYIAQHWSTIKAQGGFRGVDKDMMHRLSEDLDVSYRSLTKYTLDAEIASLFSFRRKRSTNDLRSRRNSTCSNASSASSSNGAPQHHSRRRLSLLSLRSRRSHDSLAPVHRTVSVPTTPPPPVPAIPNLLLLPSRPPATTPQQQQPCSSRHLPDNNPSHTSISSAVLIDALLPVDHSPPPSSSAASSSKRSSSSSSFKPPSSSATNSTSNSRPTRLRFELPKVPQRPIVTPNKFTLQKKTKKKKKRGRSPLRYYRFGFGYDSSENDDDDVPQVPVLGARVELLRRPLPMQGTIKFIGPVRFALGIYVGIELDNRLGSHDGSLDGHRYFSTDQQRGTFCKLDDFKIISFPASVASRA